MTEARDINTVSIENNVPMKNQNKTSVNLTTEYESQENDISLSNRCHCKSVKQIHNTQDTESNSTPVANELMKIHNGILFGLKEGGHPVTVKP